MKVHIFLSFLLLCEVDFSSMGSRYLGRYLLSRFDFDKI